MYRVTGKSVSKSGRVITLSYSRAPEPNEEMDARDWAAIRSRYVLWARHEITKHGRPVEIYGSAPECQDWLIEEILP